MSDSIFTSLKKSQAFVFGLIGGFLVLCTIGFFVVLGLYLSSDCADTSEKTTLATATVGEAKKFNQCLDEGRYADLVQSDLSLGASLGVQGTPATFINGYLISGAFPYDMVKQVIDDVLADKDPSLNWDADNYGELVKVDLPELDDAVWLGNKKASVSVIEFSDFECPYCNRFYDTMEQILAEYENEIKFTYRHFPLSFHPQAQKAAEAFECAKAQGKTWEMYRALFEQSKTSSLSIENFKKLADEIGLK